MDLDTSSRDMPPTFARTIPSTRGGTSSQAHQQALEASRRIERLMSVPRGGSTRLTIRVTWEDERLLDWEPVDVASSGAGPTLAASEEAVANVVASLLLFTPALGERTVSLTLEGAHRHGEGRPRWSVVEARVLEPPHPPQQLADFHQEYRALHEHILFEFQEQSRDVVVLAAGFTLEQVAYAVVGGLLARGALALVGKAAPTVVSFLSQGGKSAVRWFRNLLVRAPTRDRELLARLWLKAETQGIQSLTEMEKHELRAVMGRLEGLLGTPLDRNTKIKLWELSRREYFELHNPALAKTLGNEGLKAYQVHHIYPMQYAHLFPRLDINGKANLAGLHVSVHRSISSAWSSLGHASERMKAEDVKRMVELIQRHYGRWFDRVFDPTDAGALVNAERAALSEVAKLKASIIR